ncbi:MAG: hypothetical protein AB1409_11045 [Pseudomonadota bacterium]
MLPEVRGHGRQAVAGLQQRHGLPTLLLPACLVGCDLAEADLLAHVLAQKPGASGGLADRTGFLENLPGLRAAGRQVRARQNGFCFSQRPDRPPALDLRQGGLCQRL